MKPSLAVALFVSSVVLVPGATARAGEGDAPPPATAPDAAKFVADLASADLAVRRKAAYALWQSGAAAPDAVLPLAKALLDADSYVRTTAAKALSKHPNVGPAKEVLAEVLTKGASDVRLDAAKLLLRLGWGDGRPIEALTAALADADPEVRATAAAGLEWSGNAGKPAVEALLRCVTEDDDPRVRSWAARALGSIDGGKLVAPLVEWLSSEDPAVRAEAAALLGCGGTAAASAARPLARLLADENPAIRAAAASALGSVGPGSEIDRLLPLLDDPAPDVRTAALAAMNQPGTAGMEKALPRLAKLLDSEDAAVRAGAACAIASIDPVPHVARLAAMFRTDPSPDVRWMALIGLSNAGLLLPTTEIPTLEKAAEHGEQRERMIAHTSLTRLGKLAASAGPSMLRRAGSDADPFVRQLALFSVPRLGVAAPEAVPVLTAALASEESMVRSAAAQALGEYGSAAGPATAALAGHVGADPDSNVRSAAALTLGKIGPAASAAAPALRAVPGGAPYLVRVHAAYALASVSPEDAEKAVATLVGLIHADPAFGIVPITDLGLLGAAARPAEGALRELLGKREPRTWVAAALALCRIGGDGAREALDALVAAAGDTAPERANDRFGALSALAELPQCADRTIPVIVRAFHDPNPGVRATAIQALETLGPAAKPAVPDLEKAAKDPARSIGRAAEAALLRIRG